MPPGPRKRRQAAGSGGESDEEVANTQRGRNRRPVADDSEDEDNEAEEEDGEEMDLDGENSQDQSVKKLVRYALACEYSRLPITRTGIREKIGLKQRGGFRKVFEEAQKQLRTTFGMEMVQLPIKEKVTLKERRAAGKSNNASKQPTSYILTTILPSAYRIPAIIPPSIVPSEAEEAAYVAICTVIVSLIALNGGQLPEHKLDRYLSRMNIEENMPMDKTQNVLQKMIKQGYVIKVKDRIGDEETIEWMVGPRGRTEIGNRGVQGLVKEIYGEDAPEDLDKRLQRSLGMELSSIDRLAEEVNDEPAQNEVVSTARPRRSRGAANDDGDYR
ncbi:MAGE family-domain-containing protein [Xylogone sp. PMI_703]|nr:MAGE family-domain-containing protein [Xylogone sp. PMI_703]